MLNKLNKLNKKSLSIISVLTMLALSIITPQSAQADKGYRYWGYFQAAAGASNWTAAMTGPTTILKDGDVEGWTFTASSNDIPATEPMASPISLRSVMVLQKLLEKFELELWSISAVRRLHQRERLLKK